MIRGSTAEISIKKRLPNSLKIAVAVVCSLGIIAVLYGTYRIGVADAHPEMEKQEKLIEDLTLQTNSLKEKLDKAREDLVVAQRHRQIQSEAYDQLTQAYSSSERKNSYLATRLDFYRSIISPQDGMIGPSIQAIKATHSGSGLDFNVTLVQAIKHKSQIKGSLEVALMNGQERLASWPDGNKSGGIAYQYFQEISGTLVAESVPENATLLVVLRVEGEDQISREFRLNEVLEKTEQH